MEIGEQGGSMIGERGGSAHPKLPRLPISMIGE